jgi:hypothetical protein
MWQEGRNVDIKAAIGGVKRNLTRASKPGSGFRDGSGAGNLWSRPAWARHDTRLSGDQATVPDIDPKYRRFYLSLDKLINYVRVNQFTHLRCWYEVNDGPQLLAGNIPDPKRHGTNLSKEARGL